MSDFTLIHKRRRHNVSIEKHPVSDRLVFTRLPFALKDEIKAMKGSRWDADNRRWTVDNCFRNHFQLQALSADHDPYKWFDRPVEFITHYDRPLKEQQVDMISRALTYRYQIFAAEMGLGKTLAAIETMERLLELHGRHEQWFVGPRSALQSVELDMKKWDTQIEPRLLTYEGLTNKHKQLISEHGVPRCIIFDESSNLKQPSNSRSMAAQSVADQIRETYAHDGCVILMSGTVTAKEPSDIWSQAEVAWPGFLREGTFKKFEDRYAYVVMQENLDGVRFRKREGWKLEEVERIPARTKGLMTVYRKEDYLDLPERTFEVRQCPPSPRILRIAKALVDSAPNTITALTNLRALSSGFQYDTDGDERTMVETKCPKDDELRKILDDELGRGRAIVFASFQGSIDRVKRICQQQGWDTITVDGRGWQCFDSSNNLNRQHILDFWSTNERPTVFIGNPASCRFGLTLVEAKTVVVFDQNFSAECRLQSLDRNYRIGQDEPVRVIDLMHLPVDELVLSTLNQNRKMEELSLGLIQQSLDQHDT